MAREKKKESISRERKGILLFNYLEEKKDGRISRYIREMDILDKQDI